MMLACDRHRTVCLDELCHLVAAHNTCTLTRAQAGSDLAAVAAVLCFLFLDRVRRPGLALRLARATGAAAALGPWAEPDGLPSPPADKADAESPSDGVDAYSVWVNDPPPDATDCEAWRDFFEGHFGEVGERRRKRCDRAV